MTTLAQRYEHAIATTLATEADPARAVAMRAYMRDRFDYFGVPTPQRRTAMHTATADLDPLGRADLLELASRCWTHPQREVVTCAIDLLMASTSALCGDDLGAIRTLIVTNSWWDSIDPIASHVVGRMVLADRTLAPVMDDWIDDSNFWLARTALLHQLTWKTDTDTDRLFAYCLRRGGDKEFFLRKAIGWALRQYARTDPEAVRRFVADHDDELSHLSKREARRHLA